MKCPHCGAEYEVSSYLGPITHECKPRPSEPAPPFAQTWPDCPTCGKDLRPLGDMGWRHECAEPKPAQQEARCRCEEREHLALPGPCSYCAHQLIEAQKPAQPAARDEGAHAAAEAYAERMKRSGAQHLYARADFLSGAAHERARSYSVEQDGGRITVNGTLIADYSGVMEENKRLFDENQRAEKLVEALAELEIVFVQEDRSKDGRFRARKALIATREALADWRGPATRPSPSAGAREFVLRLDTLIVNNLDENQQRTLRERGLTLVRVREVKDGE